MKTRKQKGDIGVAKVIADLVDNNYAIFLPISEHPKYDLLITKKDKIARVQVKYAALSNTKNKEVISASLKSVYSNTKKTYSCLREKNDYDILAIYCPNTKLCYYLADGDFNVTTAISLRIGKPQRNYKSIKFAENYISIDKAWKKWIGGGEA